MSRNEKKRFRLLLVVFGLSAAVMFALGRTPMLHVEADGASISKPILGPTLVTGHSNPNAVLETGRSTGISGALTQNNFRRDHDMTVEMISVGPEGFEPTSLTRPSGRFLLAINNRSGMEELTVQLIREDGTLMQEARVNRKQPNWRGIVNLPTGTYRLTETSNPKWVCRIVLTAQR